MRTKENSVALLLLLLLTMAILMVSCRKDDEPEEPIDQPQGLLITPEQLSGTSAINATLLC
ncbi:hypothetical protein N9954_08610 [Maribacter sp.]|nr:hypothetical protein [Maribacter sp.]